MSQQSTYTFRVVPIFTVQDLNNMIMSTFLARGFARRREYQNYGFYYQKRGMWLQDTPLSAYAFAKIDDLEYRMRFRACFVAVPKYLQVEVRGLQPSSISPRSPLKSTFGAHNVLTYLVDANEKIEEIQNRMTAIPGLELRLVDRGGDPFSLSTRLWTIMDELGEFEPIFVHPLKQSVSVSSTLDPEMALSIEIDISQPFAKLLPCILRRFGVDGNNAVIVETGSIGDKQKPWLAGKEIDLNKSLLQLGWHSDCLIWILAIPRSIEAWCIPDMPTNIRHALDNHALEAVTSQLSIVTSSQEEISLASNASHMSGSLDRGFQEIAAATIDKLVEKATDHEAGGSACNKVYKSIRCWILSLHRSHLPKGIVINISVVYDFDNAAG